MVLLKKNHNWFPGLDIEHLESLLENWHGDIACHIGVEVARIIENSAFIVARRLSADLAVKFAQQDAMRGVVKDISALNV